MCVGGWPFSTAAHGWPISDCTAEGLKGVLALHGLNRADIVTPELRISDRRLCDACDVILSFHNADVSVLLSYLCSTYSFVCTCKYRMLSTRPPCCVCTITSMCMFMYIRGVGQPMKTIGDIAGNTCIV